MARRRKTSGPSEELRFAVDRADLAEVEQLLAAGADPNEFDSDGQTALTVCCQGGNASIARVLLAAGVKVDACGTDYIRTPLCFAAARGDLELVQVLVGAGADVNAFCDNVTPLSCASRSGNLEIMRYLLDRGANVKDPSGKSMLAHLTQYTKNRAEVEALLRGRGAE